MSEWIEAKDFDPAGVEVGWLCWIVVDGDIKPAYYDPGGLFLQFNSNKFYEIADISHVCFVPRPALPTSRGHLHPFMQ